MYIERFREIFELNDDLKIKDLCNITGLDRSTIGKYLSGYLTIPTKHLNSICNYFNISLDYVLYLTNEKNYQNQKENISLELFSNRFKEFRKSIGTQNNIAKDLDFNRSTISDYETQKKLINVSNLYTICKKYNISADYLLGKTDFPKYLK